MFCFKSESYDTYKAGLELAEASDSWILGLKIWARLDMFVYAFNLITWEVYFSRWLDLLSSTQSYIVKLCLKN